MLKRLVEVALPLVDVSEQSAREKSVRHGHVSTLHIWWARRPLAACRAVIFASMIPDADDPECPEDFRSLVMKVLSRGEFQPRNETGAAVEDTPRNRCLEFIKHLVKWQNSNNSEYIDLARTLIAAAHTILHPESQEKTPQVLDPFAGGGAIPLESLRLGCDAHAVDINPVAHVIELCTLFFPQTFGKRDSLPVPDYIKHLVSSNRAKRKKRGEIALFDDDESSLAVESNQFAPNVEISEEDYRENPLLADVRYWGAWIHAFASKELQRVYPSEGDGRIPAVFLWARTVTCPNPSCRAMIPLLRQLWLNSKQATKVAMEMSLDHEGNRCHFEVREGQRFSFDPSQGTMLRGSAQCPFCSTAVEGSDLRAESVAGRMSQQLLTVGTIGDNGGLRFRNATDDDEKAYALARDMLADLRSSNNRAAIPTESITPDRPSPNSRGLSAAVRYGIDRFDKLFNERQLLALSTFVQHIRRAMKELERIHDAEYALAVGNCLAMALGRLADYNSMFCVWGQGFVGHTFGRQALAMVWDYCEANPIGTSSGNWTGAIEWVGRVIEHLSLSGPPATVRHGSATRLPFEDSSIDSVSTDPPYYDSVPYSDLSDFFYVWLKRTVGDKFPDIMRTPLTPKAEEVIAYFGSGKRSVQKTPEWYEEQMEKAFSEIQRVVRENGIVTVMFAHKTTTAWESIIAALHRTGLAVTSSWPIHTERAGRLVARNAAALASSVTLVCRKRNEEAGDGLWDDVRQELKTVAKERLDFFWDQGIRGADFFISAIGPALSVFGHYAQVIRISGEEVTVGEFLDEVRSLVTNYALTKILHTTNTANIDPESRFYVVWKWSYGDAKVPADESFKLAQALGIDTEEMWDKTGVLTKSGENVQCVPVEKRMKVKDLGEPEADGTPSSLIDVLHRMCVFRDKSDNAGMAQFLGRSGQARNSALWLIAQAVSEILPDGEREKQLMQGLLNQQEGLEEATRQGELF